MAAGLGGFRHYQLTLNGSAQQLKTVIPAGQGGDSFDGDPVFSDLWLQGDDGNLAAIRIGGDSALTAASYGVYIVVPATPLPFHIPGPVQLSQLWAIGTNNEVLNIFGRVGGRQ